MWNQLDHGAVDATTINTFKSKLDRFRCTRMGFFMDQSAEQEASLWEPLLVLARPHKVSNNVSINDWSIIQRLTVTTYDEN